MVIKINPRLVDRLSTDTALIRHELTHYLLSQDYAGGSPKWLSEGIATWVQYYPDDFGSLAVPAAFYRRLQHADHRLPIVGLFNDDPSRELPDRAGCGDLAGRPLRGRPGARADEGLPR